jgi:hypothetical protein
MRFSQLFEGKGKPQVELGYSDLISIIDQIIIKLGLKKSAAIDSIIVSKLYNDPKLSKHKETIIHFANTDYYIGKAGKEILNAVSVDKKNIAKFVSKVPKLFEREYKQYGDAVKKLFDEQYKLFCRDQSKQLELDLKLNK